jgi:amino acid adenylation domain-containing protein
MKAGAAYLPLSPDLPAARRAEMIHDAAPSLVLDRLPDLLLDSSFDASDPEVEIHPEYPAYVIYTSGSTGTPKGMVIRHRELGEYLAWAAILYQADSGIGAPVNTPLAFDATVTSLYLPLISGRRVILLPRERQIEALARLIESGDELTLVKLTPAHLEALRYMVAKNASKIRTRLFVVGGEALGASVTAFWREEAPHVRIVNEYGPTETVVGCCVHEVTGMSGEIPIGRPTPNTHLYVLDTGLEPAGIGQTGELYIAGAQLGSGYLNRRGATAERFVADPHSTGPGARMYRTGDLARRDAEGILYYAGRADGQVKIRGFRIEPAEIEAALTQEPGILQAAVVVRKDSRRGPELAAFVVGPETGPDVLRRSLAARLPDYMIPAAFVFLDALPLTGNGKVDRKALAARSEISRSAQEFEAPRGRVEEELARIWSEILGAANIGRRDDFFALGGHSLLAMRMRARVQEALNADLSSRDFFEARTIADLAVIVQAVLLQSGNVNAEPEYEEMDL